MFHWFSSNPPPDMHAAAEEPAVWRNDHVCDVRVQSNWLSEAERSALAELSATQDWTKGRLHDAPAGARECDCAWLARTEATGWLYEKLADAFVDANRAYRFDLEGMNEPPQLLRYGKGGHLAWHQDVGLGGASVRKLALVVLVSRSDDCAGGALQFCGDETREISMQPGTAVIFPPFLTHRVTPLAQGSRISLVAWAVGPAFR